MVDASYSKLLIANRGEIAVRIVRTCRQMQIKTVAIYSTPDSTALHVQSADEAYWVGPAPAAGSYLNIDAILGVARASGAEAVHPGYGFLAENAAFAQAVYDAGLIWIGPDPEVIALMGDKVAAKRLAGSVGVPLVPGYEGEDQTEGRMLREAERLGFPVMLKAAAGGGGRGMRVVADPDALSRGLESARREARAAFGDDRIFLEKLLKGARHVEIQVVADSHGNVIHLGERDCSIQRRQQKVVEESPSPVMTPDVRDRMGRDAVSLARAAGYVNIGTVEFLFSADSYYFLEMNTRIQVEHPVTELITGLDLVRLQLQIASGRPLGMSQLDVRLDGHAIEARVYAEDAQNGFLPATGRLRVFQPPLGPGVRNDVGVLEGSEVTTHYDPLLAKLVVAASTRSEALGKLDDALAEYSIVGVTTNLAFLRWVAQQEQFKSGRAGTEFLEENWRPLELADPPREALLAAASAVILSTGWEVHGPRADKPHNPWRNAGGRRPGGSSRSVSFRFADRRCRIDVVRAPDGDWDMTVAGQTTRVRIEKAGAHGIVLSADNRVVRATTAHTVTAVTISLAGRTYTFERDTPSDSYRVETGGGIESEGVSSPMPGTVVEVAVQEGQHVGANQPLVVLEAMKMEHVIQAPHEAIVQAVLYGVGDLVPAGATVVRLELR